MVLGLFPSPFSVGDADILSLMAGHVSLWFFCDQSCPVSTLLGLSSPVWPSAMGDTDMPLVLCLLSLPFLWVALLAFVCSPCGLVSVRWS